MQLFVTFVGAIAMVSSTLSLLPQIHRTYKTRSVGDLSPWMLMNLFICSISWVIYGLCKGAPAIWITNSLMSVFSSILLWFFWKYRVHD